MEDRKTADAAPDAARPYEAPQIETVLTSEDLEREGQYAGMTIM